MKDRTTEYARLIVSGGKLCGQAEYQACQRHLQDMADKELPYIFDAALAEKHITIANQLTIGEGNPKPLVTRGFQNFILGSLFGWRRKRSKLRRFREAYIQVARQNGKSFLAGEMCNDFASFGGYHYGRIFCVATKQEQANIVWDEVDKFIESDSDLLELYKIRKYDHRIKSLVTGTEIKAIGRDTKSADGFRSILAVVDEYHAHPTNQMYKLMNDGQVRVDNALTLAITTAGFNLNGPCYEQYQFCKKILSGNVRKDSLFIFIAEMDEDDDIWEPKNWAKANPLNLWNEDNTFNEPMMARMAEKAIDALLFPLEDDRLYIWSHSYMPELRLQEHIQSDDAPYGVWKDAGLLTLTSGMYGIKTDYKHIISELADAMAMYDLHIVGCGYDSHNASAFLEDLEAVLSCDLTEVKQSARALSDVTIDFQLSVKSGQVCYDEQNALMTWSVVNAVISAPNSFGEIKIDKMTQTNRIDVVDAIIDAWKVWFTNKDDGIDGHAALADWLDMTGKEGDTD